MRVYESERERESEQALAISFEFGLPTLRLSFFDFPPLALVRTLIFLSFTLRFCKFEC